MKQAIKRVIFGVQGLHLTAQEKEFFQKTNPLGFILFSRNIDNPTQLKELTEELYSIVKHPYPHILIDQEGGRVSRLKPPFMKKIKPAGDFIKLALIDLDKAAEAVFKNYHYIGKILVNYKINVDCAPVCDLFYEDAHDVIGDRSFGADPNIVIKLCQAAISGLHAAGVISVIKHIPGHGRAKVDSHLDLPRVSNDLDTLERTDFSVFKALNKSYYAMTAHIVYDALDAYNPVTQSKAAISYLKEKIGFTNLLISDDIGMKALSGNYTERANKAQEAGCDIVLFCNGSIGDYEEVANVVGCIDERQLDIIKDAYNVVLNGRCLVDDQENPFLNTETETYLP
jgi:beta-N-acetylhexosaminidase